jgi:hypothetical protein
MPGPRYTPSKFGSSEWPGWWLVFPLSLGGKCMMNYLSFDLGQQPAGATVHVTLEGNAANVRLLDSSNYRSYRAGREHRCYGGYYDRSPVVLRVPN